MFTLSYTYYDKILFRNHMSLLGSHIDTCFIINVKLISANSLRKLNKQKWNETPKREISIFFNKMCKQLWKAKGLTFFCWFSSISKNMSFLNYYDVLEVFVSCNNINIWAYFRELYRKPGRRTKTSALK